MRRASPGPNLIEMFKSLVSVFGVVMVAIGLPETRESQRGPARTFDNEAVGSAPAGFTLAAMRQPTPGIWAVRKHGAGLHLVHEADASAAGISLAILSAPAAREFVASVRLRLAGGVRSGGLAWQYQDEHNFYAAILDLTRQELSLYRVTGGNRVRLEAEDDLELDVDAWHTLKVARDDGRIYVALGGIRVFEERDGRGGPEPATTRLGLVSAGNAETWFDDLRVGEDRDRR